MDDLELLNTNEVDEIDDTGVQNSNEDETVETIVDETIASEDASEEEDGKGEFGEWIGVFLWALLCVFVIMTFFFRLATVDGSSMYPTLKNGEVLVISNFLYEPKQGDIVVVQQSNIEDRVFDYLLVKRVIATGGQTLEIDFKNWVVTVDGVALDEPYVNYVKENMKRLDMKDDKVVIPDGYIFVMGDNRNNSTDSRYSKVGFIREDEVVGRALLRLIPFTIFK